LNHAEAALTEIESEIQDPIIPQITS